MATLEKSSARSSLELNDSLGELALSRPTPLDSAVPTPFPEQTPTATTTSTSPVVEQREGRKGRSPSIGRSVLQNIKRSFSRDRPAVADGEASRSRSGERRTSVDANSVQTEDRGRSIFNPLRTTTTNATTLTNGTRSTSRGRVLATGRGGAGNMHPPISGGPDETSETIAKAREEAKSRSRSRGREIVHTSGRGGAGNMKGERGESTSRNRLSEKEMAEQKEKERKDEEIEKEVLAKRQQEGLEGLKAHGIKGISSGRGGVGNIRPIVASNSSA